HQIWSTAGTSKRHAKGLQNLARTDVFCRRCLIQQFFGFRSTESRSAVDTLLKCGKHLFGVVIPFFVYDALIKCFRTFEEEFALLPQILRKRDALAHDADDLKRFFTCTRDVLLFE